MEKEEAGSERLPLVYAPAPWWRRWAAPKFWAWTEDDELLSSLGERFESGPAISELRRMLAKGWDPAGLAGRRRHDPSGALRVDYPLSTIGHWMQVARKSGRSAAWAPMIEFAAALAEAGAPLDRSAKPGGGVGECSAATLLGHAVGWGTGRPLPVGEVVALLALGASPDARCADGLAPLWICAFARDPWEGAAAGAALIEAGADPCVDGPCADAPEAGWSRTWREAAPFLGSPGGLMGAAAARNPELASVLEKAVLSRGLGDGLVAVAAKEPQAKSRRL